MTARSSQTALLLVGGAATYAANQFWRRHDVPGAQQRWDRTNHRGDQVSLLEGPSFVVGVITPLALTDRPGAFLALGAGVVGAWDDLHPDAQRKGLAGHLGALRRAEISPGVLKILGLGASGALSVWLSQRNDDTRGLCDLLMGTALVAGSANLVNLFDLRPGRALKVAAGCCLAQWRMGDPATAAALGAVAASMPLDLSGKAMLGDTGANPLGALLGLAAARQWGRPAQRVGIIALIGLTLLSERVSFSQVIAQTPVLRELDQWGRA